MDGFVDENKSIQRKIVLKSLEVHPTEQTIILNCEIDSSLIAESPDDGFLEKSREFQRYIRLKSLDETSDIDSIVTQVINKSKCLLTGSHRDEIKQLIVYLKNRSTNPTQTATGAAFDSFRPKTAGARLTETNRTNGLSPDPSSSIGPLNGLERGIGDRLGSLSPESIFVDIKRALIRSSAESGNDSALNCPLINHIDNYIELLYEDYADKMKGASMIYSLSLDHDNLILLTSNEPLNCALARLLREDGRRSLDLSTILIGIFATFSVYRQFHSCITRYKVGALCLDAIRSELEREENLFNELADIQLAMKTEHRSLSNASSLHSSLSYSHLSTISAPNAPNRGSLSSSTSSASLATEYEKTLRKYQSLVNKQNLFLRAAFTLLMNLSEDKRIEMKMVNKGIVGLLVKTLDRENWSQLLYLAVSFLKRLSIFGDNKDSMISNGISEKLAAILDNHTTSASLLHLVNTLQLIYNLSFDSKFRGEMVSLNLVHKIFAFLHKTGKQSSSSLSSSVGGNLNGNRITNSYGILEKLIYQLIYLITIEEKARVMVTLALGPDRIHLLTDRMIKHINDKRNCPFPELMALLINLATNRRNAQYMCEKDNLKRLVERIVTSLNNARQQQRQVTFDDILILKLIRNISQHEDAYKMIFLDYLETWVQLLVARAPRPTDSSTERLVNSSLEDNLDDIVIIEMLGIIGNMNNLPGVNWYNLAHQAGLWKWLKLILSNSERLFEDDLILECILIVSAMVNQKEAARYLIKSNCLGLLIEQLNAKQEEDEIVLQIIYTFHLMLREPDIRRQIISQDTQVMAYLFDLMNDKNPEIRRLCKQSLNIILEFENEYGEKIKEERFKSYNKQWLEMVISRDEDGQHGISGDADDELVDVDGISSEDLLLSCNNLLMKTDIFSDSPPSSSTGDDLGDNFYSRSTSRPQTGYKTRCSGRTIKSGVASDRKPTNKSKFNIINL